MSEKGIEKFAQDEKLSILKEAQINGVKESMTIYELYLATL